MRQDVQAVKVRVGRDARTVSDLNLKDAALTLHQISLTRIIGQYGTQMQAIAVNERDLMLTT